MKLVHVTTVPQTLGFLAGQVGYMKARGIEVHALSSPGDPLRAFGEREGVPVHAVEMPRRISPLHDLGAVAQIRRELREIRPRVVHAHTPKGGLLGTIAAAMERVPVRIYHIRGLPFMTASGKRRALLRATERVSCALAHHVLCVSHSIRDVAVAEGICPPHKIHVLRGGSGNGVDASGRFDPARWGGEARAATRARFGIPADAPVLGFVGRLVPDKGIRELAAAWASVRDGHPDAHLLLVGPFEDHDPLPPETLRALRGDPRVHLAGETAETPAMYAAMDVLVFPTYREGFPNVPLEAASMELPVLATRVPGCTDAVRDGATGTLVPAADAAALAAGMRAYLGDPALRRAHGRAGRARVLRDFRREDIWAALYDEYVRLAGAPAGGAA